MAKGRQQYFADEVSIQKEAREFAIEEQLKAKIDSIEEGAQVNVIETVKVNGDPLIPDAEKAVDVSVPLVEDTLYSVDTEAALSARQGKVLYDYILNLQSRGRYLSNWNCATGLPTTNPYDSPYEYRAGDYFLVSNVSTGTNYRPDGSEYIIGVASTTVETEIVGVSDMYIYDGTAWQLIINSERPIAIDDALSPTSTNPVENRVVTQAIGTKQNIITDLQTIREGAAKGDTAVQPGDSLSTLSGDSDDIAEGSSHLFMTTSERTKLGNQSGVNTGDETQTTIKAKLGPASATTDGYLTSTDWNKFNDKQDAIQDLQTIRDNATAGKNASDTIATYGDIVTHNVNEFATAAQGALADSALQSGDNVSELVNDAGYITDAYHDDTKQDKLIAGANIQIAADGKTISATDTTYVAGDFDIKDLADSTGLRTTWSGKQDALDLGANLSWGQDGKLNATDTTYTAGDGIEITQNNVIRNTRTSAEWGNITGTLSDQTDLQSALDEKQDKLTAGDNITIEDVCHKNTQGPCPNGFHIPTRWYRDDGIGVSDIGTLKGYLSALGVPGENMQVVLKNPTGHNRWQPWRDTSHNVGSRPQITRRGNGVDRSVYSMNTPTAIRPFKNDPVVPDNNWTILFDGSSIAAGAGVFWSEGLGLISISADGVDWITLADKNLGATQVYNQGDAFTAANTGNLYQWGNNFGRPYGTTPATTTEQVDASGYGPGNYYYREVQFTGDYWDSSVNSNLWGCPQWKGQIGTRCALEISAQVPDSAEWGNITGTLSNQTDLQNALDGKVNLGNNKVYDNTVVEIGKWVHGESADVSGHHITLDPNGELSTYNVTVAGHNEATLGSGNLTLLENTALGGDETTVISQDGITISEGQTTKTYNFLGNDRIATLSDVSGATSGAVSDAAYDNTWDGVTTVAPSKNVVYDKIEADLNTKTFYIRGDGSAEDLQRAQAAWDWILAGKNALLIDYDKRVYTLTQSTSSYAMFYCDRGGITYYNSNAMIDGSYYIRFSLSSGAVTSISGGGGYSVNVLQTDVDYSTPYTPLYNGSPATKKYVDDAISGAGYTAGDGINIDANNEISNTLPGPTIAATAPTGTEGALWYDTTNNVLMAHDGTAWKEAGTQMKVLSYGHSTWQDFLDAYNENAIVYCKASSQSNPGSGNQGRMAFMAFVDINSSTGVIQGVEFQYYRSRSDHNTAANQLDEVYVYKLTSNGTWTVTQRNTAAKAVAGTGINLAFGSGNMTISNTGVTSFNGDTGAITLTPGTYISLNNNVIDVDTSLIATKADLANFAGFLVVAQLPTTDIKTNIIYLLGPVGTGADKYEEYIYSNNNWILIGDTTIDLSPYFHKTNDDSDDIIEGSTNLFLTSAERTILSNTSGTNSGDETKTTIQTKLGAASSSNSGYLTSADYDTIMDGLGGVKVLANNTLNDLGQELVDWFNDTGYAAGYSTFKDSIMLYNGAAYYRRHTQSTGSTANEYTVIYSRIEPTVQNLAAGYSRSVFPILRFTLSYVDGVWSFVSASDSYITYIANSYLRTDYNYSTPYTPLYNGSPATKKYVDDAIAGVDGITNNTTGTTTAISQIRCGTEAEYQALGTYQEGIAYMTF